MAALRTALWVAALGGLGSVCRYGVGVWLMPRTAGQVWPTFAVNVVGCLVMGVAHALITSGRLVSPTVALALTTGFLGGFTTFSALGLDTFKLFASERAAWALAYALGSVVAGVVAVMVGVRLGRVLG